MYNTKVPGDSGLPTSRQLLRSTVTAFIAAAVILVTVVLPSEYGVDPTGIGRLLGLKEMGVIKAQLADEASDEAAAQADAVSADAEPSASGGVAGPAPAPVAPASAVVEAWRDEMRVSLEPGQGAEIKLGMKAGERADFQWLVEGGTVNFDLHGSGGGNSVSYEKGRNVPSGEGTLEAAFDGEHGWFWRNRGDAAVTVVIRARGQYAQMKRVL